MSNEDWTSTRTDDYAYHGGCTVIPCAKHDVRLVWSGTPWPGADEDSPFHRVDPEALAAYDAVFHKDEE